MAKTKATRTPPITVEQLGEHFGRGVGLLDQIRAAHIAHAFRLESAQDAVDVRELVRLRRKYGDGHPRTKEVGLRIEQNREYRAELVVAHRYASTPASEPGKGWTVDGFVHTPDGAPVTGVTVAGSDRQGKWLKEFGHACTDEKGYFRLVADTVPDTATRVYMRAFERDAAMPSNENRLAPEAGRVDRIEIVVDRTGNGDCRPPGGTGPETRPPEPPAARAPQRAQAAKAAQTAATPEPAAKSAPRKKKKAAKRKARGKTRPRK